MSPTAVRAITPSEHQAFIDRRGDASFLQTPAWGDVKSEWQHESIGWIRDDETVGAALVLYRRLPKIGKALAYLPEGPLLDWSDPNLPEMLGAMTRHLRARGSFGIRMGPPVTSRTWTAETVKKAIADDTRRHLGDVPPDSRDEVGDAVVATLREAGWRAQAGNEGFSAGQPQFVFQVPLAGRDEHGVLAGMNQLWRRNIKKAVKSGVDVRVGSEADLPAFHALYVETAIRDHFTPRPLAYFQQMFTAMAGEDPDRIRLYLASHESDLVAAATSVRVGSHVWYSYGASSTAKREVRASNAVQWQMIRDAIASGATVYDLRGITGTLAADDPHIGLIQFKVGTGGNAVEYVGEWDLPLNRLLYKAFELYMTRRQDAR
ncbi:MAG: peptidoglycan bridge formation glycyltransferase FemA/FemB family protein [Nocardioidaceae bacterium]